MLLDEKNRLNDMDWAYAVAIMLVVFGNLLPSGCWPRTLIYSFHIPLLGILGGILFIAPRTWGELGKKSLGMIKRLLIPYVIFFSVCCLLYCLPTESMPRVVAASAPSDWKELLQYFLFFERRTVWNVTLFFLPCYMVISFAFLLFAKLTRGSRLASGILAAVALLGVILLERVGVTVDLFGVKDAFGMRNYFLMLGFFAMGYVLRPTLDAAYAITDSRKKGLVSLASFFAFCVLSTLCLAGNAVEITKQAPAGYYGLSMYSGLYNGMGQFVLLAVFLSVSLIFALIALPQMKAITLLSRSTLFVMLAHGFVLLDKTFGDVIPYELMWEIDMRIAYRDAVSVIVLLLVVLFACDAVQKKFPSSRRIFSLIGIK